MADAHTIPPCEQFWIQNVLLAGLESAPGASHRPISLVKAGQVRPAVTTPLAVEDESVLSRPLPGRD